MKIGRLFAIALFSLSSLTLPFMANAELQAGKEYVQLRQPIPVETGPKIEVLEIFFYGCPHCFDLEPTINAWAKKLPKDVTYRRMPAIFRDNWEPLARAYYAIQSLKLENKLHAALFDALHVQGKALNNENAILDWVAQQGVDRKKFAAAYRSFNVNSKVERAKQLTTDYGISGVPSVVVDGRFVTSSSMAGGHEQLLTVLDELIKKARALRAGQKLGAPAAG